MLTSYTYVNPCENGYDKISLTKKQHNQLFSKRQTGWKDKYEYFISADEFLMHRYTSLVVKALNVVIYPLNILCAGINNINELNIEYRRMFNEKACGAFSGDNVFAGSDKYKEIESLIK